MEITPDQSDISENNEFLGEESSDSESKIKETKVESNVKKVNTVKSFKPKYEEITAELKIPRDRVAILIGKEGSVKKRISDLTQTRLEIDSKEGDVTIYGEDGLRIFEAREV